MSIKSNSRLPDRSALSKTDHSDFWNDLPPHVKAGIERGKKQAAEGKLTPHDEVMKRYAKYL